MLAMANLYTFRNFASVATHYSVAAGVAAASYVLGQPWTIVAGAAMAGVMTASIFKFNRMMNDGLIEHPKIHEHSPKLGQMVEELYKASGLSSDKYPVYDFQMKSKKGESSLYAALRQIFGLAAKTPNAAASHWDKPVIMISEPLLELLEDDEERAVLAHEFAHVTARHGYLGLPQRAIGLGSRVSNALLTVVTAFSAGFMNFAGAFGSALAATYVVNKLHPKSDIIFKSDDDLTLREKHEKKSAKKLTNAFGMAAGLGAFAYFVPAYVPIWAAVKAINVTSGVAEKTFSRSNEYQADRGAVVLGADPLALITSLRRITALCERSRKKAWGDEEPPQSGALTKWWKQVNSTHPKLEDRIGRLADIARNHGRSEKDIEQAVSGKIDISKGKDIPYDILKVMASRLV